MPSRRGAAAAATTRRTLATAALAPARLTWHALAAALLVGLVALGVYLLTLAPTVTFVDSGELIVAAEGLGVPHPPGFPVWAMLAHAATWLPFGPVAVRVHLLSAVCAATAAALVTLVVATLAPAPTTGSRTTATAGLAAVGVLPPLLAGFLFAFSRTLWGYATVAEVYTLNTALLVGALLALLTWRTRRLTDGDAAPGHGLYLAALLAGLGLGVHHVSTVLALPGLLLLVLATATPRALGARRVMLGVGLGLAGVATYAYLPLAAAQAPLMNWGDPRTLERVWWHVTGRQYHSYFTFSAAAVGHEALAFVARAGREVGPWAAGALVVLGLAGLADLVRRDRVGAGALLLIAGCTLSYAFAYGIAEDKEAYYLPAFFVATILVGSGAATVLERLEQPPQRALLAVTTLGLAALPVAAVAANWRVADRSNFRLARDYVDNVLADVAPNGLVLTFDWQLWAPWLYARTLDGGRPDVTIVDVNLLRRSWYFDLLQQQAPDLLRAAQPEVDAFLEDLREWERAPERYARDAALTNRISARFVAMILAFARNQLASAPLYVTQDVILSPDPQAKEVGQALSARYTLVPMGLVFGVFPDRAPRPLPPITWETRGLATAVATLDPDDVVRLKVVPVYVAMLYNRGRYLAMQGNVTAAREAFEAALSLDPRFAPARTALQGLGKRG